MAASGQEEERSNGAQCWEALAPDELKPQRHKSHKSTHQNHRMDAHTFSDPILIAPCEWTVDVIRLKDNCVVGTLELNSKTLPPRRNRKKILWQLPSDDSVSPKFGKHEKERLWGIFKNQRKERKKKAKNDKKEGNDNDSSDKPAKALSTKTGETSGASSTDSTEPSSDIAIEDTRPTEEPPPNEETEAVDKSTLRPPGFPPDPADVTRALNDVSLQNHSTFNEPLPAPQSKDADAHISTPPGFSSPPPPPPGFGNQPDIEPHQPINSPSIHGSLSPIVYFPSSDARFIVSIFKQSPNVSDWIAHYIPSATTTILLGQAPATCQHPSAVWSNFQPAVSNCCNVHETAVVLTGSITTNTARLHMSWMIQLQREGESKYCVALEVLSLFAT